MKTYIGIDPGKSGAIAVLNNDGLIIHNIPILGVKAKRTGIIDFALVVNIMCDIAYEYDPIVAILEKPIYIPGKTKSRMFEDYGTVRGIIVSYHWPYHEIKPTVWQKIMFAGEPKRDNKKTTSIIVAQRLFPTVNFKRTGAAKKVDHNRCDAALLAEYGRRLNL